MFVGPLWVPRTYYVRGTAVGPTNILCSWAAERVDAVVRRANCVRGSVLHAVVRRPTTWTADRVGLSLAHVFVDKQNVFTMCSRRFLFVPCLAAKCAPAHSCAGW